MKKIFSRPSKNDKEVDEQATSPKPVKSTRLLAIRLRKLPKDPSGTPQTESQTRVLVSASSTDSAQTESKTRALVSAPTVSSLQEALRNHTLVTESPIGSRNLPALLAEAKNTDPTKLQRPTVQRENSGNLLVTLIRDLNQYLLYLLPLKDAVSLSMTCYGLWIKNQTILLDKVFKDSLAYRVLDGFYELTELFKFDPFFSTHKPVFSRPLDATEPVVSISHLLSCTHPILFTMVSDDPYSAWKIGLTCGFGTEVLKMMRKKNKDPYYTFDQFDRGIFEFSALGGQLAQIETFVEAGPVNTDDDRFDLLTYDSKQQCSIMASFGGQVPVLSYLEKQGYDLKRDCSNSNSPENQETLLNCAVVGGNSKTITFLEEKGCDPSIGKSLAFFASSVGHWKRYNAESRKRNPVRKQHALTDAKSVAGFALSRGNLEEALRLIEEHKIPKEDLFPKAVCSGDSKIFWHFVDNNWLPLTHQFGRGQRIEHLLAQKGRLATLIQVLEDKRATNGVAVLDNDGQSIQHYAARGNRWDVYCHFRAQKLPEVDLLGNTIAHCASEGAAVWFLKHLHQENSPHLFAKTNNGSTILHSASKSGSPNLIIMIVEEIGIDFRELDEDYNLIIHLLAQAAAQKPQLWNTLNDVLTHFDAFYLVDAPNLQGNTVRQIFIDSKVESSFPDLDSKIKSTITLGSNL